MRILIVGVGALGGTLATRALSKGIPVRLATRTDESARRLQSTGLQVSGFGGAAKCAPTGVALLEEYAGAEFDLVLIATKAHEALDVAPALARLLSPGGTILPIQNGAVSKMLSEMLGSDTVLGGLSNLGATMVEPGRYVQTNSGHLLIGEIGGGGSRRSSEIARTLSEAVETRLSANILGAMWAKLIINCSVTTVGAVCAQTMRQYISSEAGALVFRRAYDEALSVAIAAGVRPERMMVEPVPPGWPRADVHGGGYNAWLSGIISAYGDIKPSMLQDFERGRRTEIDFINGYVTKLGEQLGKPVATNRALTDVVHQIEAGRTKPGPERLRELLVG